jgi:proline iminopeptidase
MFRHMNQQVYNTMQGPNEFVITGNFKDWNRWNDLARINVHTLVIGAQHDTMSADDLRRMGALIPNSRVAICERGSHLAMYDDQEPYFQHLVQFILDVEAGQPL